MLINLQKKIFIQFMMDLIFVALTITSCTKSNNSLKNITFEELMSIKDLNNSIKLTNVTDICGVKTGNYCIGIQNMSTDKITFPVDWGIKIFMDESSSENWIDIKNDVKYSTYNGINPDLNPMHENNDKDMIMIHPVLSDINKPAKIRIFVEGDANNSDFETLHPAAAFIDLPVKP